MNCTQAQELFNTYLDGDLTGSLATEFAAHKLHCPACRRELALLEVTGHVISADTASPLLSDEFTERLLSLTISAPVPWYRRRRLLLRVGAPLAAAACLALVVYLKPAEPEHPSTMVLPGPEYRVDSPEELLRNVEDALANNPDNPRLQALAERLRSRMEEIASGTTDGAETLENYGKKTIMEILNSVPIDATPDAEPDQQDPGDQHDQAPEEHP